ncbi:MAG: SUMF1/EgtB/PvdO family nonheme iron enzyme [Limnothrix sp.]
MTYTSRRSPIDQNTCTALRSAMQQSRKLTLALFADLDDQTFRQQAHPDFSPAGWHLGHLAFTESLWILEKLAGQKPLFPEYRQLFAADGLPKAQRQALPDFDDIQVYLEAVRIKVFEYLAIAPLPTQERLWWWLLQHETQHNETIAFVLALHRLKAGQPVFTAPQSTTAALDATMANVPAGEFVCGSDAIHAQDNERSPHSIYLDAYDIDTYSVTCGEFQNFIDSGGYKKAELWSEQGWHWQNQAQVTQPLYWQNSANYYNHPVCGVSYFEAEAYANFVGKRLPTEFEWEKAATPQQKDNLWRTDHCNHSLQEQGTTPVNLFVKNQSLYGCKDQLGNVWEWTQSIFRPYPNFQFYPYKGYSAVYFDEAHYVLRGGSWVTRPWGIRHTFRNWYHPWTREIFAGFRCVAL